jgi:uncharacterized protein with LGFP repeats
MPIPLNRALGDVAQQLPPIEFIPVQPVLDTPIQGNRNFSPQVYREIGDRYNEFINTNRNCLGLPVTEEMPFVDGGRVQKFERGYIYWWPGIGYWAVSDRHSFR